MLNRILSAFMWRIVLGFVFLAVGGIGTAITGGHRMAASAGSGGNPWSKDYVAPEPGSVPTTAAVSYGSYQSAAHSYDSAQADEDRRDEAFRRQRLREWRENYESRNGPDPQP